MTRTNCTLFGSGRKHTLLLRFGSLVADERLTGKRCAQQVVRTVTEGALHTDLGRMQCVCGICCGGFEESGFYFGCVFGFVSSGDGGELRLVHEEEKQVGGVAVGRNGVGMIVGASE